MADPEGFGKMASNALIESMIRANIDRRHVFIQICRRMLQVISKYLIDLVYVIQIFFRKDGTSWIIPFVSGLLTAWSEKPKLPWDLCETLLTICVNFQISLITSSTNVRDCLEKVSVIQAELISHISKSIIETKWKPSATKNEDTAESIRTTFANFKHDQFFHLINLVLLLQPLEMYFQSKDEMNEKGKLMMTRLPQVPVHEKLLQAVIILPYTVTERVEKVFYMAKSSLKTEGMTISDPAAFVDSIFHLSQFKIPIKDAISTRDSFGWSILYWKIFVSLICLAVNDNRYVVCSAYEKVFRKLGILIGLVPICGKDVPISSFSLSIY